MHPNFSVSKDSPVKAPMKLAHVVLRTNKLEAMTEFYTTFLGAHIVYRNNVLVFLTYDDEHHRIALAQIPGTADKNRQSCGLEHIAFNFETLGDLLLSYRQRQACGIEPVWCVNHGPTTSIYYKDPDGNMLETQTENFETLAACNEYMMSDAFARNPIGLDFDPDEYVRRLEEGESEAILKDIGDVPARTEFPAVML